MRTIDVIRDTKIDSVVQESSNIRSMFFKDEPSLQASPGQFVMVWVPGVGEFPMSLSLPSKKGLASIGVKAMGEGSRLLYESKVGDFIGIRGPYGKAFQLEPRRGKPLRRVLLVGGGTGMTTIVVLAKELSEKSIKTVLAIGARTKDELPFVRISKRIAGAKNVYTSTDDGSFGFRGLVHEQVRELVSKYRFDEIFSCGPEKMMAHVFKIAKENQIPVQFSLERIMKCGIGICGSCTIGQIVLCKDGPVLDENEIDSLEPEFGQFHRNKTGKLCPI